jgi:hypothetical protein
MGRRRTYLISAILACMLALSIVFFGASGAVPLLVRSSGGVPAAAFSVIAMWSQEPLEEPTWSPAEVVAMRFPDESEEMVVAQQDKPIQVEATDATDNLLFNPYPMVPPTSGQFGPARPSEAVPAKPEPVISKPTMVAAVSHSGRPDAVFNDAQIATIRQRLKLRPEQQYMWPAVEAALRNLSYPKGSHRGAVNINRVAAIDPSSTEVQNLNNAAVPLVMSFNEDQRRELVALAHIAGLENLIPKF